MKIITRLKDLGIEVETDKSKGEAIQLIFEALQDGFQNQADNEAYFSEPFLEENFVFGCDAPDKVRLIAHSWNEDIKNQFVRSLTALGCPGIALKNLPMDTPETYDMQKAARELNNNWWAYADHGVYLNNEIGFPYFQVILTDKVQADIMKNPSEYIVADLYVKD